MDNTIYIIFGVLFVVFLLILINNKSKSKKRNSKSFMGDYKRKDKSK